MTLSLIEALKAVVLSFGLFPGVVRGADIVMIDRSKNNH
jgi:hypothetical protein